MSKFVKTLALMIGVSLGTNAATQEANQLLTPKSNPVIWFEIPALDLERAADFYEAVFEVDLQIADVGPSRLALFPSEDGIAGAAGALAKRTNFEPSTGGALVFFSVSSIGDVIARTTEAGGQILMPQTELPGLGYTANIGDTEGNQIALYQLF
jgi:predicted enzyme related to lactoylglutathione lyase